MERNLLDFHIKLSEKFRIRSGEVKTLIGDKHAPTSGFSKEKIVRDVLHEKLPGIFEVNEGFVLFDNRGNLRSINSEFNADIANDKSQSNQIDVLIHRSDKPILHRDDNVVYLTKDAVSAIISVKTSIRTSADMEKALEEIADDIERIRENETQTSCLAGLFIYQDKGLKDKIVLECIQKAVRGNLQRMLNFVSVGPNRFFRFWLNGMLDVKGVINGPTWHSYKLIVKSNGISHSYFISNVVFELSKYETREAEFAWFPIEGGKESYRQWAIGLTGPAIDLNKKPSLALLSLSKDSKMDSEKHKLIHAAICKLEQELEIKLSHPFIVNGMPFEAGYSENDNSLIVLVRIIDNPSDNLNCFSDYLTHFIWRTPNNLFFLQNTIIYLIAISNAKKIDRMTIKKRIKNCLHPSTQVNVETECYSIDELIRKYG